jgi:hypothetical protein
MTRHAIPSLSSSSVPNPKSDTHLREPILLLRALILGIIKRLHLIHCRLPLLRMSISRRRLHIDPHDGLSPHICDAGLPIRPVGIVADQEAEKHAGIHLAEAEATQAAGVHAAELFVRVGGGIGVEGKGGSGLVRVEVEEGVGLAADEVVAAGGAATGDANGLRVAEAGFERFVVDWSDAVWAEADAKEDEGRLQVAGWVGGDAAEGVFVDVGGVGCHVDSQAG